MAGKHEPGPWRVRTFGPGFDIESADGKDIGFARTWPGYKETSLANAELMARAPDMADEVVRLRAALKPFAEAARNLTGGERDSDNLWESPEAMMLTVADLRAAAALA